MGNQLAATAAVDLANVSDSLELVCPLGAEGRNYFATFHCLYYEPISAESAEDLGGDETHLGDHHARTASSLAKTADSRSGEALPAEDSHARLYSTIFMTAEGECRRTFAPMQPTPTVTTASPWRQDTSSRSRDAISVKPLMHVPAILTSMPLTAGGAASTSARGRGRGRGRGRAGVSSSFSVLYSAAAAAAEVECAIHIASRERAAWHQARWRQRLSGAPPLWRTIPSSLWTEEQEMRGHDVGTPAAISGWYRDTTAHYSALAADPRHCKDTAVRPFMNSSTQARGSPVPPATSSLSSAASFAARDADNIDGLVTDLSGEWRSHYSTYVQLFLRSGAETGMLSSYAAAEPGGLVVTLPSPSAASQSFRVEDVVTKVFVRTVDDAGQSYFLSYVRQMIHNSGDQLRAVDSTLPATTPRNILWYSLVYEGEGFCVLQRPYIAFTLRERLLTRPAWSAQEKLFVVFQLLEAVAYLHETYGLTHGDIKPNNVMVQSTGQVVLCDMAPFKPCRMPLDSPLLFDYYYDTDENRACYVAPEKFTDQPLPNPPLASKTRGSATYNVRNVNFDGHTASMDVFSTACVILYIYKGEDPFTLSQVLGLRQLTTSESSEAALLPVLRGASVPQSLYPLLTGMLCSAPEERPSARELLEQGLRKGIFPPSFAFLYQAVWPRLLSATPEARLFLLHNQIEAVLGECASLDGSTLSPVESQEGCGVRDEAAKPSRPRSASSLAEVNREVTSPLSRDKTASRAVLSPAAAVSPSQVTAVLLLLPLLLQTLHSERTSDEATHRGLLCLSRCVSYCRFSTVIDVVLPHVLFYVSNTAHVYGSAARLVALRLLGLISETVAQHLTLPKSEPSSDAALSTDLMSGDSLAETPTEEQWVLLEHLVLPCLCDVLRQAGQESTAVLVEVASRLPRLLLLARYITERRQLVYGHDVTPTLAADGFTGIVSGNRTHRQRCNTRRAKVGPPNLFCQSPTPPPSTLDHEVSSAPPTANPTTAPVAGKTKPSSSVIQSSVDKMKPIPPNMMPCSGDQVDEHKNGSDADTRLLEAVQPTESSSESLPISFQTSDTEEVEGDADTVDTLGAQQYFSQLRCLLDNGWGMLQLLYNHSCVPVAVAIMQQTTTTVAAFLGEERVVENLIPLLTTALSAPLRVQRLLYRQAIVLHAILQRPQVKTLRLFVEEGLRHKDGECVKATLDSLAVVIRSGRLPSDDIMTLVHQCLPSLTNDRLWLREAACGVVEAAAQAYPPSDIVQHLEYAVRPLLTAPVPLSQLRRYAASAIRAEMALSPLTAVEVSRESSCYQYPCTASHQGGSGGSALFEVDLLLGGDAGSGVAEMCRTSEEGFCERRCASATKQQQQMDVGYQEVLPAIVSVTRSYAAGPAPQLLHTLPPAENVISSAAAQLEKSHETAAENKEEPPSVITQYVEPSSEPGMKSALQDANGAGAILEYRPSWRETHRLQQERIALFRSASKAAMSASLAVSEGPRASMRGRLASSFAASLYPDLSSTSVAPHRIDVCPAPRTIPPPSSMCSGESDVVKDSAAYRPHARTALWTTPAAASAPVRSSPSLQTALCPSATPLCSRTLHTGAIYAAAPSPLGNAVAVSAGARAEAFVWQIAAADHDVVAAYHRELRLVNRVPLEEHAMNGASAYTACQWMSLSGQLRKPMLSSTSPGSASTVAFTTTDGVVQILDVEKNVWVSSIAVCNGNEDDGLTALALQDEASLLVTTAAGGLHILDTRCTGRRVSEASAGKSFSPSSIWRAEIHPFDGPPTCLCPLYSGDKACAVAVGTCGGVMALFDLRYQLCAKRVVLHDDTPPLFASWGPSRQLSITAMCADPLSTRCRDSCSSTREAPPLVGPSILLGTTSGAVYRLVLPHGGYWPAFQSASDSSSGVSGNAVRVLLSQPSHGCVLTGSEDGYIRLWSTDSPETSQTLTCPPFLSPPYTVVRSAAADRAGCALRGDMRRHRCSTRHLAYLSICEGRRQDCTPPPHAPDAILTLCAVRGEAQPSSQGGSVTAPGGREEPLHLLSGSRDGTLTLWSNSLS